MDINCGSCGHPKSEHHGGRGRCSCWDDGKCHCATFIRIRWDKWQPAKLGTQPAMVRFHVHNNPTKWSVNLNKKVKLQVKDTMQVVTGIVDKVNPDGMPFIELF